MHSFLALITIDEIEIVLVRYHSPRSLRQVVHNRHVNGEISDHSECRAPWFVLQLGWEEEVRLSKHGVWLKSAIVLGDDVEAPQRPAADQDQCTLQTASFIFQDSVAELLG